MAMFSGARSQPTNAGSNLVEFKAGRCTLEQGNGGASIRKVVASKEKGVVYIKQSTDQLIHFCWRNRDTGAVVDDLIIFPGDTEFVEVKGCPDGLVYMLKFKNSEERRLFWAQDQNVDPDLCQKVNDALNRPPNPVRMGARGGSLDRVSAPEARDFVPGEELGALGGLDQRQLMQLLQFMQPGSGGSGNDGSLHNLVGSTGANTDSTGVSTRSDSPGLTEAEMIAQADAISQRMAAEIERQRREGPAAETPDDPPSQVFRRLRRPEIDLADVITGERVRRTVQNNLEQLTPHGAPDADGNVTAAEASNTVHTPQFRQVATAFGHALQTGQMADVIDQFGLGDEVKQAAQRGDLLGFAEAMTAAEQGTSAAAATGASEQPAPSAGEDEPMEEPKEPEPKRGKTDDDEMELD